MWKLEYAQTKVIILNVTETCHALIKMNNIIIVIDKYIYTKYVKD